MVVLRWGSKSKSTCVNPLRNPRNMSATQGVLEIAKIAVGVALVLSILEVANEISKLPRIATIFLPKPRIFAPPSPSPHPSSSPPPYC